MKPAAQDWRKLRVYPLASRKSLTTVESILVDPDTAPPPPSAEVAPWIETCAAQILAARQRGAGVMLLYGAHLLRNGTARILGEMMERGWLTHLATNGAGTIHDWEYAWLGRSTESVRENVASGSFGTWDETGRYLMLALMAGALHGEGQGEGYGQALGRFIAEDRLHLPAPELLRQAIATEPDHPLTAARADLLRAILTHNLPTGDISLHHPWKHASLLAQAFRHQVPLTVHPGIGYDIIANHPLYDGGVVGRAATTDFRLFSDSVETLDGGVVLSVGSAIMGPQVFEKALSCVNNLRLGAQRPIVRDHSIYVVDLQESGGWDWTQGDPPKSNPAYYLRFCKSFGRMGGAMQYLQCDNYVFAHNLLHTLRRLSAALA